ncbi:MAG: DUF4350 domain-containing protein [Angustibacter sp.]
MTSTPATADPAAGHDATLGRTAPVFNPAGTNPAGTNPAGTSPVEANSADAGPAGPKPARPRRWWVLGTAGLILLATLVGTITARPSSTMLLDPESAGPDGALAVTRVLAQQGTQVRTVRRFDDLRAQARRAPGPVSIMLARPDRLAPGRAGDLRELLAQVRADLVLVAAENLVLSDLDLPVGSKPDVPTQVRRPVCDDPVARRAGPALSGGVRYVAVGADDGSRLVPCYIADGFATYLAVDRPVDSPSTPAGSSADSQRTTLIGDGRAFTNARLAEDGNAALAFGSFGRRPVVVWWTPDPLDGPPTDAPPSLVDLLPDGVLLGAIQGVIVLLVLVLWRVRRLGRLVTEPLPVIVRAIETTQGRASLYRRARARGRAAQVLRVATVRRLAQRCGLASSADPEQVAGAVARATGRPSAEVVALLIGPDPPDDVQLVLLARSLLALEEEVRRP